jgi:hypothetical protein
MKIVEMIASILIIMWTIVVMIVLQVDQMKHNRICIVCEPQLKELNK